MLCSTPEQAHIASTSSYSYYYYHNNITTCPTHTTHLPTGNFNMMGTILTSKGSIDVYELVQSLFTTKQLEMRQWN